MYSVAESGVALNAGAEGLCRWGELFLLSDQPK